ncbi:MAG: GBS Bsp-like repeat-containing protein [Streptococcus sp.]|nr:GBS Bsp-like repeat-containing protein [Streptococcus sp.]
MKGYGKKHLASKAFLTIPMVLAFVGGIQAQAEDLVTTESSQPEVSLTQSSAAEVKSSPEADVLATASSESQATVSTQQESSETSTELSSNVSSEVTSSTASSATASLTSTSQTASLSPETSSISSTPVTASSENAVSSVSTTASTTNLKSESAAISLVQGYAADVTNLPVTSVAQKDQALTIQYNRPISSDEVIKIAVWSDLKGQDDLKWYTADKLGAAYVELKNHRDYGKYNIHTYADRSGRMVGLNATELTVKMPKINLGITGKNATGFDISISNVPNTISSIKVPVWSDHNGQDDLVWYTAAKESNGTYRVTVDTKNHKSETGQYHIHAYGQASGSLQLQGLTTATYTVTPSQADAVKQPSVSVVAKGETAFVATITNVPSSISSVKIPVWTNQNGQDDLVWYTANKQASGTYQVTVEARNHKSETGQYHVHFYGQESGRSQLVGLAAVSYNLSPSQPESPSQPTTNLPSSGTYVFIERTSVRSEPKLTSPEVVYYEAGQKVNYDRVLTAEGYEWISYMSRSGVRRYAAVNKVTDNSTPTPSDSIQPADTTKPALKVTAKGDNGFDITISNVSSDISAVMVPVWSEKNGQDDIKWYQAKRLTSSDFSVTVELKDHQYQTGSYNIHVYGRNKATDKLEGLMTETYTVPSVQSKGTIHVENVNNYRGTFDLVIANVGASAGIKEVLVPVWSEQNGQDDIKWYQAQAQTNGTYKVTVFASNHKYTDGKYLAHLYYKNNQGALEGVASTSVTLSLESQSEKQFTVANKTFTIFGKYNPTYAVLQSLANTITTLENQGYNIGFKLVDADTNKGIAYNQNSKFYSASTIKGPFVASLVANNSSAFQKSGSTILDVLRTSSNEGYKYLRDTYGPSALYNWAREAGVATNVVTPLYPYLTAQELFALWQRNYQFFTTSNYGKQVGTWFENPNLSPIKSVLGSSYKTQSKAGWIGYPGYRAANDAGIVYTPKGNYIVSIMTNADGRLGLVNPTVLALNSVYFDIKK